MEVFTRRRILVFIGVCITLFSEACAEICNSGISCRKCCSDQLSCCNPDDYYYSWNIWNMWYFWFIIIFVLLSCFGGCGYWRRRQVLLQQRHAATVQVAGAVPPGQSPYFQGGYTHTTYGTPGMPPQMAGPPPANFSGPPAYTEVISKPDVYPAPNKGNLPPYAEGPVMGAYPPPSDGAAQMPSPPPPYTSPPYPSNQNQGQPSPYPVQQTPYQQTPYPAQPTNQTPQAQ